MSATEAPLPEFDDPPELIELSHERVIARIDPDGAYVDSFVIMTDEGPVDLLLARQSFDIDGHIKLRGTHPCIPIFGPHEGLKQHGFGRDLRWDVIEQSQESVTLSLDIKGDEGEPGVTDYRGLLAQLTYDVADDKEMGPRLNATIKLTNKNDDKPLIVAPGLHPYLALPEGMNAKDVDIYSFGDPTVPSKVRYEPEVLAQAPSMNLRGGHLYAHLGGGIQIWNRNLPITVIWTDRPDDYLCIEPTSDGPLRGLLDDPNFLWPGASKAYSAEISWGGYKKTLDRHGQ